MQSIIDDFRCPCGKLCILSVHFKACCNDRGEKELCIICGAYKNNMLLVFEEEKNNLNQKEINFIKKNNINKVYNYEYLLKLEKVSMDISPSSAFEIIKSIDDVEDHIEGNDVLYQFRMNLCSILQIEEDEIDGLDFQQYVHLKLEELS